MNWFGTFEKTVQVIRDYYWIALIPIALWALLKNISEEKDIEQNLTESYGEIYNSTSVYKKASKNSYKYKFEYNGIEYFGSSIGSWLDGISVGKIYKVEFSSKNPQHSQMNFEIEYSKKIIQNKEGKLDTVFIPTSELQLELSTDLNNRLQKLKKLN
ncbi:hypothetical protein [Maribacter sp. R86514]|uniref:hypothetical protein n=1 Tax=Maribacter sp. R86514 TaxID=3093854 RepID=UPI0037C7D8A8